jgi:hypothetical protein
MDNNAIGNDMRKVFIAVFLIGCGSSSPTPPEPLVDGGRDGGPDGGQDGGPDGGSDGGSCVNTVQEAQLDQWIHVPENQTPVYTNNPPVSGQHYERTWARWQIHTVAVPRGYWVHNLEHGGVAFLYNPDAGAGTELVRQLTNVYGRIPTGLPDKGCEDHNRAVLTPDPLLDAPWAVTASGTDAGYYIKASCIASEQALVDFAVQHRGRAAENECGPGYYP